MPGLPNAFGEGEGRVAATLRDYVARSGALHVAAATPAGMFGCDAAGTVTFQSSEADEPVAVAAEPAEPVALEVAPRALPPFDVDVLRGEVTGPLGGLEHVAEAALALSRALGAPSAAVVWLATTDGTELAVSAREGESVVVVVGDEQFEMEEGWPPPRPAPGPPD